MSQKLVRTLGLAVLATLLAASPALAQQKMEVSVLFGYTLSDGVSGSNTPGGDGNIYNRIDPKDSGSWGLSFGYLASDQWEFGFLFGQQMSKLNISGSVSRDLGDQSINTYHPYVAYNLGDVESKARPYFLFGMGATNYGSVTFTKANGGSATTQSETQFSTTWGAGIKMYPSKNVGVRAGVQWTPTYIKSDPGGYWCDPYWGCYVTGNPQYSNQFQFNGGVTFRF